MFICIYMRYVSLLYSIVLITVNLFHIILVGSILIMVDAPITVALRICPGCPLLAAQ